MGPRSQILAIMRVREIMGAVDTPVPYPRKEQAEVDPSDRRVRRRNPPP
jgi:hypothetical protein